MSETGIALQDCGTLLRCATKSEILMLAYYFPPMNVSGADRPFRFAKYLNEFGYDATVITGSDPGATPPWPASIYTGEKHRYPSIDRAAGWTAKVIQRILPYNDQIPWIPEAVAAATQVLKERNIQVLLSTSPPLATHLAAAWLKRRLGVSWIADLRDPIVGNPFRPGRFAEAYDRSIEAMILRNADAVIGNTSVSVEELQARYPKFRHKVHLIWNGYDPEEQFGPLPLKSKSSKVLVHAGSLYGGRHPGVLLKSVERLLNRGVLTENHIRIHLIGEIDYQQPWVAECDLVNLKQKAWFECIDKVLPRSEAQHALATADYLLLLDTTGRAAALQVPAKLFEYVRIGRPVLAFTTRNSPTEYILKRSGVRYACIYQNEPEVEVDSKVLAFLNLPSIPVEQSAWFHSQFDGRTQTGTLADVLRTF
jgi:glycosyltransferase involved in cell wall biosynthesis